MSAYGTKKRGGDFATQLTFPAVFSEVYAMEQKPLEYAVSYTGPLVQPLAGDDFQSKYHTQKKRDADYMATQKVVSTRNARHRYLVSPHGYFDLPPTQLVQRVYANPSNGSQIISSSRRDGSVPAPFTVVESGSLEGGVLRTAKGQAFGKARLTARIGQLNNIAATKEMFVSGINEPVATAQRPAPMAGEEPVNAEIELNLLLSSIIDSLMGSASGQPEQSGEAVGEFLSRFTFGDAIRAVSLIFRLIPTYGREDVDKLEDNLGKIDTITNLLTGLTDPDMIDDYDQTALSRERLLTTLELFKRLREYMTEMIGKVDLSPKERKDLSKALVKSFGFTKFLRDIGKAKEESIDLFRRIADGRLFDARGRQAFDDEDDDDEDDDDDFDGVARPREDEEQDGNDETFDEDERQVFGYQSGQFYSAPRQNGRAAPQYFGYDDYENAKEEEDVIYGTTAAREEEQQKKRSGRNVGTVNTTIRSVFDPVLGSRNVEVVPVLRSDQHSYASAKTAPRPQRVIKGVVKVGDNTFAPSRVETQLRGQVFPPRARSVSTTTTTKPKPRKTTGIPSVAPSRTTTTNSRRKTVPEGTTVSGLSSLSSGDSLLLPKEAIAQMNREQLVAYARRLNESGRVKIRINKGSTEENIRRNFYRRLGYEGRK